jgi:rhodanese-related sulfurtransferase
MAAMVRASVPASRPETSGRRPGTLKHVLIEGLLVAIAGAAFAFSANWLACELTRHSSTPLGLELARNYFPRDLSNAAPANAINTSANIPARENLEAQLRAEGLRLADSSLVAQLYQDPRCQQGLVVFVDARDNGQYEQGHIPGAYLFNEFHRETYLATVVPVCQAAEQVVIYCDGGTCDLSINAAKVLRDLPQIGGEKLFVYAGGMAEWTTNGLPVEIGERNSGKMREPKKLEDRKQGALRTLDVIPGTERTAS